MTHEQIKQNAEEYANHKLDWSRKRHSESPYLAWKEGFEDGAHSRDEEIGKLKMLYEEALHKYYEAECKLRNPWISVEDRLPEINQVVLTLGSEKNNEDVRLLFRGDVSGNFVCIDYDEITHWMPIPEL